MFNIDEAAEPAPLNHLDDICLFYSFVARSAQAYTSSPEARELSLRGGQDRKSSTFAR